MRKKAQWVNAGGLIRCVACQSLDVDMCDHRKKSGIYERETKCRACGDLRTTKIEAPKIEASSKNIEKPAPKIEGPAHEIIELAHLAIGSVQPRAQMDLVTVAEYGAQMRAQADGSVTDALGEMWPRLIAFRSGAGLYLADGFHRAQAARDAGLKTFQAVVHQGSSRDALHHALTANARHGLRRTNADKRRAVELMLDDVEWVSLSDSKIALHCGVTQPFVSKLRGERRQAIAAKEAASRARAAREVSQPTSPEPITVMGQEAQVDLDELIEIKRREVTTQAAAEQPGVEVSGDGDEWSTPDELIELVDAFMIIDLDPATNEAAQARIKAGCAWTKQDNGLEQAWFGGVWLNPPYSQPLITEFIDKALAEWQRGEVVELLVLTNTASSAAWYQKIAAACTGACFLAQRVRFCHPDGRANAQPMHSQTLFYFGHRRPSFALHFSPHGTCWQPAGPSLQRGRL